MRPVRASFLIILICAAGLGACAGPMSMGEARERAQERMTRYCAGKCAALRLTGAQKIKDRWLIEFDSAGSKYTVVVDNGGNAQLSIWDKSPGAAGQ
jgi:hypothetical protein